MTHPPLFIEKGKKLPQFDMPIDFIVYDDIRADLLKFYALYPCKIEACVICFVERGSVTATINLWDYEVKRGDCVVLIPGSFIQIKEVSDDLKVSFEGYSSSFLKRINFWKMISPFMLRVIKNPIFHLNNELSEIFSRLISIFTQASVMPEIFLVPNNANNVLNFTLDTLNNAISANVISNEFNHSSREQTIVSEFMQLAIENYRDEHKISFYAQEANLTLSHFCNVVRRTTGLTPQEIIMNLIIMDAKTQLKGTDTPVSQIATSLGFPTPTTFNRYFRNYTGMTPQAYRNS